MQRDLGQEIRVMHKLIHALNSYSKHLKENVLDNEEVVELQASNFYLHTTVYIAKLKVYSEYLDERID